MDYLAYGGYRSDDDMASIVVAGLGFLAIGLILGYVLGAGRVPGVSSSKKSKKK
jgi:hypothetical protein